MTDRNSIEMVHANWRRPAVVGYDGVEVARSRHRIKEMADEL